MKVKMIVYALIAITCQVGLGYLTGLGQGGIAMLTFIVLIEIDPNYSFSYLLKKREKTGKNIGTGLIYRVNYQLIY